MWLDLSDLSRHSLPFPPGSVCASAVVGSQWTKWWWFFENRPSDFYLIDCLGMNCLFASLGLESKIVIYTWIDLSACACTFMFSQFVLDPMLTALEAQWSQWECRRLRVRMSFCHVRSTVSHHPPSAGPRRGSSSPPFLPGKTHWESHTRLLMFKYNLENPLLSFSHRYKQLGPFKGTAVDYVVS